MSLITECRSSQRQRPTCPRTRAQELSLTYTGTIKASLLRTFRDVFWMCRRALDLLLFRRNFASVSGPENVTGSSFSAHVVVFKPCKMLQSHDIVHPGCKIEMTLELLLLLHFEILCFKIAILPLLMPLV